MSSPRHQILCVDDDLDTCEIVKLSHPEIRFTFAHTFAAGFEAIRSGVFDLYLLDSWLPDGAGIDLCTEIRKTDESTPIVFLSAAAYVQDHQRAIEAGASAYLDKPSDLFRLDAVIVSLIWEAESKSLAAKAATVSLLRKSVEEGLLESDEPANSNREKTIRANEGLLRARAYSIFIDYGGVKAHFERIWPAILDEVLANHAAT
jgi:DNA-binding response OmpR family regulator